MSAPPELAVLAERIGRSPFHQWLSLEMVAADSDGVLITAAWRDEIVSQVDPPIMHGGVVAALLDVGGLYALLASGAPVRNTAYLHVDFHRSVVPGPVQVRGEPVRIGRSLSVAQAKLFGGDGQLLASGRGGYVGPRS
ncbi:PaaI family thioesterase [Achromobacter aegrifaciens]